MMNMPEGHEGCAVCFLNASLYFRIKSRRKRTNSNDLIYSGRLLNEHMIGC